MKRNSIFAGCLLLAVGGAMAQQVSKVPDAFAGKWCGGDLETRLEIKSNSIAFYESKGPIKTITLNGDNEMVLVAQLSGEGEKWMHTAKFRLSKDGKQLIDADTKPPLVRRRCAK